MDHQALRGSGYISQARPQDVTPSFECGLSDLCQFAVLKMSKTRRPLGSLASEVNEHGEEVLRTRVGRERTHLERQAERMYERGEETWRRLTRQRVAAFLELFLLAMVRTENAHRAGYPQPQSVEMLLDTLVKRIIPWEYRHRVWSKYEGR